MAQQIYDVLKQEHKQVEQMLRQRLGDGTYKVDVMRRDSFDEIAAKRRSSQPPGASMGSMFKNPPGDYAGRLIEAAGLKGTRVGGAEISTIHANFFVNLVCGLIAYCHQPKKPSLHLVPANLLSA